MDLPHDYDWELDFGQNNVFEELVDKGFGVAAHYTGTYRYHGEALRLKYAWSKQEDELRAVLSDDKLVLRSYCLGWKIEFAHSNERIEGSSCAPASLTVHR